MKLIIEKLDARYKGFPCWTHRVEFQRTWVSDSREETFRAFINTRIEFWELFGPGCDREELFRVIAVTKATPEWGWWVNPRGQVPYIYFKDGPVLSWFLMRT